MAINTLRTGWNTRGGTMREHLQIQQNYQRTQMLAALKCLLDEIGEQAYLVWVDEVIDDEMSASQIIQLARDELDLIANCTCRPDAAGICPACLRYVERNHGGEELPF